MAGFGYQQMKVATMAKVKDSAVSSSGVIGSPFLIRSISVMKNQTACQRVISLLIISIE